MQNKTLITKASIAISHWNHIIIVYFRKKHRSSSQKSYLDTSMNEQSKKGKYRNLSQKSCTNTSMNDQSKQGTYRK